MSDTLSPSESSYSTPRFVVLCVVIALSVVGILLAAHVAVSHIDDEAEQRLVAVTRSLSQSVEQTTDSLLDTIAVILRTTADEVTQQWAAGNRKPHTLDAFFQRQRSRIEHTTFLAALDASGRIVDEAGLRPLADAEVDRNLFVRLREDPNADLLFGRPGTQRGGAAPTWQVGLKIRRADGSFGGVVVAAINLDDLRKSLENISMPRSGSIALRDADMHLIARHQFSGTSEVPIGDQKLSRPYVEALKINPGEGTYISGATAIDNVSRTHSYRRNMTYGFTANVGLARDIELGGMRRQALMIWGLADSFALSALVFAWLISRSWRRQNRVIAALRESSDRLFLATGSAGIGVWDLDLTSNVLAWDEQMYRIYGVTAESFDGAFDAWAGVVHEADRARVKADVQAAIREKKPLASEFRIVRPDGETRMINAHAKVVVDAAGVPVRMIGTNRDVTERRVAEEELRIAATVFDCQEGMMVTNPDNIIIKVNQAFTLITGYTAAEVVGRNSNLLKSGRHDRAFYTAMWQRLQQTGSWQGEVWNRRKSGEVFPEWLTITAVKDDGGMVAHYVATLTDITQRKANEDEIKHLAFYDPLTRLPNRRLLLDRLHQALAASTRSKRNGALLFIDLDNFKTLNDTLGHDMGDILLQQVAARLLTCVREGDTVARQGGDEFVVMLEDLSGHMREAAAQAEAVGEKILAALNQPYQLAEHTHRSTPSIGATLFNDHRSSIDELLKQADLAMYQVKSAGRNAFCFFDPEMQAVVSARATLEADLRRSLAQQQFVLHYQIQVDAAGRATGAEALVRWCHPDKGLVRPGEFVPLAEETGLILPLGHWVLETACRQLAAWATQPDLAHLTLAVNVSAKQFQSPDFMADVQAALEHTGATAQKLKLEVTESMLITDVDKIIATMTALKAQGVCFSLDDFGTGYSSLSYLKRLPLDQLKIDQSFVRDILIDANDAAIARTTVALAHSMNLAVIAEGVETAAQRDCLLQLGCEAFQGYLFGRPLPLEEFESLVRGR